MTETQNLHLPQWEESDRIMRTDFNDAMAAIDAGVAANTAALLGKGNCQIEMQTYTGTGTYGNANPRTLTFAKTPALVIVSDGKGAFFLMYPGCISGKKDTTTIFVTWNGLNVSWYANGDATHQFNSNNTLYSVFIFYA